MSRLLLLGRSSGQHRQLVRERPHEISLDQSRHSLPVGEMAHGFVKPRETLSPGRWRRVSPSPAG